MRLYTLEKIAAEQTIGRVLQHLVKMNAVLLHLEKLEQDAKRND